MPTYEYECEACGHQFEEFQSFKSRPRRTCPACRKRKVKRRIGAGSGIIFRGSGFYETDYRSPEYRKQAEKESKAASPEAKKGDKKIDKKGPKASKEN